VLKLGACFNLGLLHTMRPSTRSRSGNVLAADRGVIKGTSGADVGGSKADTAGLSRSHQVQAVDEQTAAADLEQQDASGEGEVSSYESEESGNGSSSASSDYEEEEVGEVDMQQGLRSSLLEDDAGPVADQLFVDMPQSGPIAPGRKQAGAISVGPSTRSRTGAALVPDRGEPKGRAKMDTTGSVQFQQKLLEAEMVSGKGSNRQVSRVELKESDNVSSSADSDDIEEEGMLGEQQGLCSTRLEEVVGKVADRVSSGLPQPDQAAVGVNRGVFHLLRCLRRA